MGLRPPHFVFQPKERDKQHQVSVAYPAPEAPPAPAWPTRGAELGSELGFSRDPGPWLGSRRMFIEDVELGEHREALMEAGRGVIRKGGEVVKETAGGWGAGRAPPPLLALETLENHPVRDFLTL